MSKPNEVQSAETAGAAAAAKQSAPAAVGRSAQGPTVEVNGVRFKKVTEGTATILFPDTEDVFYNPVQEFNRDISVAVVNKFGQIYLAEKAEKAAKKKAKLDAFADKTAAAAAAPGAGATEAETAAAAAAAAAALAPKEGDEAPGINILEALSASGLRSVRYFNEIDNVKTIIANDFSAEAVVNIQRNVEFNGLDTEKQVVPNQDDATVLMYRQKPGVMPEDQRTKFDVIDLDPYGSAAPFLDAAVQTIENGGLLCVTCTDMAVLAGNHGEACYAKYGSYPLRGTHCHEMAVRIILMAISQHAARSKRYIVPYMSCSIDFYCRVFVRVYTSANEVKKTASKHSYVYNCTGCEAYSLQKVARSECKGNSVKYKAGSGPPVPPKCVHCDRPHQIGGPIYSDPIHDTAFVAGLLKDVEATEADNKYGTFKRMQGFLSVISEELPDSPLYWTAPAMCNKVHCSTMSLLQVRSAILNAGYRVSGSHANKDALKTDAPAEFMWDIIRSWCKLNPVSRKNENSPGFTLLSRKIKTEANFEQHKDANPPSRFLGVKRFQENPLPNWGPKSRAKKPQLPPKRPNADAEEPTAKKPKA